MKYLMQLENTQENLCSLGNTSKSGEALSSLKRGYCWLEKLNGIWILAVEKQSSQKL